jgi:hypothetical protein
LDQFVADQPVWLVRHDIHAAWCNSLALRLAGIDRDTPDPPGGQIVRDADGEPTGVLIDHAMSLVSQHIPEPTTAERELAIRRACAECASLGITTGLDAFMTSADWTAINSLWQNDLNHPPGSKPRQLKTRVLAMADAQDEALLDMIAASSALPAEVSLRPRLTHLKLFADGALGSRGAALFEDYSDQPGNAGLLTVTHADMLRAGWFGIQHGVPLCVHAIGDRAAALVLDAYDELAAHCPHFAQHRFRIEHVQIIRPADMVRMHRLGVIAAVQTSHFSMDWPWFLERLGDARACERAYRWTSLRRAGIHLANGSDAPIASLNPLMGTWSAITRRAQTLNQPWCADEVLDRLTALRSYTIDSAYACGVDAEVGSIELGKSADFALLDRNPLTCQPDDLLVIRNLVTILAGEVVFEQR